MLRKVPRFRPSFTWETAVGLGLRACVAPLDETGPCVFEEAFARYLGVRHVFPVASGRAGLHVLLKAANFKPGDEVLLSAFNYWAVPRVVEALGLRPVFVDIDPATCNLDARLIAAKVTQRTAALVATHLYGLPCDMDAVLKAAAEHGFFVIEDCVQALGAAHRGRMVGSLADASYFSFGLTKTMPLLAAGAVACNDDTLAERLRVGTGSQAPLGRGQILKRTLGAAMMRAATAPGVFDLLVFPFIYLAARRGWDLIGDLFEEKPSASMQAGLGRPQVLPVALRGEFGLKGLDGLGGLIAKRVANGCYLHQHIRPQGKMTLPPVCAGNVFTSFPVRVKDREELSWKLLMRGIDTSKGFMQAFGDDCPNAGRLKAEILYLS